MARKRRHTENTVTSVNSGSRKRQQRPLDAVWIDTLPNGLLYCTDIFPLHDGGGLLDSYEPLEPLINGKRRKKA